MIKLVSLCRFTTRQDGLIWNLWHSNNSKERENPTHAMRRDRAWGVECVVKFLNWELLKLDLSKPYAPIKS